MTDNFDDIDNLEEIDDYEDDHIVFADEDGNEIEFTEVAAFDYNGKEYSALTPVKEETQDEDEPLEVIFCEVRYDEEDSCEVFDIVDDEDLYEELFNQFINLDDTICGCCDNCDHDHE